MASMDSNLIESDGWRNVICQFKVDFILTIFIYVLKYLTRNYHLPWKVTTLPVSEIYLCLTLYFSPVRNLPQTKNVIHTLRVKNGNYYSPTRKYRNFTTLHAMLSVGVF